MNSESESPTPIPTLEDSEGEEHAFSRWWSRMVQGSAHLTLYYQYQLLNVTKKGSLFFLWVMSLWGDERLQNEANPYNISEGNLVIHIRCFKR